MKFLQYAHEILTKFLGISYKLLTTFMCKVCHTMNVFLISKLNFYFLMHPNLTNKLKMIVRYFVDTNPGAPWRQNATTKNQLSSRTFGAGATKHILL
jgi:hypothetical protein